jgi:hypothetical protein
MGIFSSQNLRILSPEGALEGEPDPSLTDDRQVQLLKDMG